ncbi:inositol monophosphatase family protein [Streptomyces sp. NPDC053431]|uniref:inositol monophosphatase family protein n=1 Tax=Streptomyces sp. NPDC053431 TaxID=3365703 RepID=UPI0037D078F6
MTPDRELLAVAGEAVDLGARWLAGADAAWARTRHKPSGEEVTDADVEIERRIAEFLRRRTPGVPVVGEEGFAGGPLPDRCWLLDPVDGTMNFTRGAPLYGISLAYAEDGVPRLGVVDAPALGRRWTAGGGSADGRAAEAPEAVRELSRAVVGLTGTGAGDPRARALLALLYDEAYRLRLQGSMSLDLVGVAEGWIDACLCIGPKPWDVAAGVPLVRDRGLAVLGGDGADYGFGSPVLAAGSHAVARELLARWDEAGRGLTAVR